jgi:hypothetical protein
MKIIDLAQARRARRAIVIHQNAEGAITNIYVDDPEVTVVVLIDESVPDLARCVEELYTIPRARLAQDFDGAVQAKVRAILKEG